LKHSLNPIILFSTYNGFLNIYYIKLKRLIIFEIIFLLLILSKDTVKYSNNTSNCLSIFYKKIIQISLTSLDHCLFLICASLASIQMLIVPSLLLHPMDSTILFFREDLVVMILEYTRESNGIYLLTILRPLVE